MLVGRRNCGVLRLSLTFLVVVLPLLSVTEGQYTVASLAEQLRELKETLRQRDALDQQQQNHVSRLAENLQTLTASMERYVTMLEDGQIVEGEEGVRSQVTQLALIQSRLATIEDKIDGLQGAGVRKPQARILSEETSTTARPSAPSSHSSTCTHVLAQIEAPTTVNVSGSGVVWGFWGHDSVRNDGIIYVSESAYIIHVLTEYLNLEQLQHNQVHRVHNLSSTCTGTGHIVRDRYFICAKSGNQILLKYNLDTDELVLQKPVSSRSSVSRTYQNGESIDLSTDDSWIWMVYSQEALHSHIVLEKLDPETLETVDSWETHMTRTQIGQTFVICGVLYSLDNYRVTPSYIKHVYNPRQEESRVLEDGVIVMPSTGTNCWNKPRWPTYIASLNYDHWEQALYAWNCGLLEKYPIQFAQPSSWVCGGSN